MTKEDDKISPEEMVEALKRSGYLLEARVEGALVNAAFDVEANTCYPDPFTGKSRELDIYAISPEPLDPDKDSPDMICSVVICECSNNSQPMVFLMKDWAQTPYDADKIHVSGMPDVICGAGGALASVQTTLGLNEFFHHFRSGRIATQYCTFERKQKGDRPWMATHDADDHGSLSKLCDYIAWKKEQDRATWAPALQESDEAIGIHFYLPVLVLQNELYEARQDVHGRVKVAKVDRLLYRQSHAVAGAGDFLIDVVRESALPRLLQEVEREQQEVAARIHKLHREELRKAIAHLWRTRGHGRMPRAS